MSPKERERLPPSRAVVVIFGAVLITNVAMGQFLATVDFGESWLLLATPLVVLFWTAVGILWFRVDAKETLLLRLPGWADLVMAIPLGISFVILSDQLSSLSDDLIPQEIKDAQFRLLQASGLGEWAFKILTIGVGAAVSEELLFRGFIQSGLSRSMRKLSAVMWTSFLFMALHILPLPAFLIAGLILGFTAVATRSIVVPVLIHFLNNVSALALVNLAGLETLGDPVWIPAEILLPAAAIFVLTTGYYARKIVLERPPPSLPDPGGPYEPPASPRAKASYSEELASVSPRRRRAGWLIVVLAVLIGTSVLLGLFLYSLYVSHPQAVKESLIEAISRESQSRLDPTAAGRADELASAFDSLSAMNEGGSLSLRHLWRVTRAYAEASASGSIDSRELEALLAVIQEAVESGSPRRL